MSDAQLLLAGYEAVHDAYQAAGIVVQQVHDLQEVGEALPKELAARQFGAIKERVRRAQCAFQELENRARGMAPPKQG